MHVILAAVGSYGDIAPFLWMGRVLADRGHTVDFLANPHFGETVRGQGFPFHPVGTEEDYRTATMPAERTGSRFRDQGERIKASRRLYNAMFLGPVRDTVRTVEALKTPQTVILHHFYAYGARLAAEKYGIPHGNVNLSPYWMKSFRKTVGLSSRMELAAARAQTRFIDRQLFYGPINTMREEMGLEPVAKSSIEWMFEGENACLYPDWLQDFGLAEGVKADFIGFPGTSGEDAPLPDALSEFLADHPGPVVFTPGSAYESNASFFGEAAAALEKLGRPGIFLTRHREAVPRDLPDSILHMDFVPLEGLLDRCAVLVHHGGIGTCCRALAAGIPQIIGYRMAEQKENARLMKGLGVCEAGSFADVNRQWLADAVEGLTGVPVLRRCGEIRDRLNNQCSREALAAFADRIAEGTGR